MKVDEIYLQRFFGSTWSMLDHMSAISDRETSRLKQLSNLYGRGRRLSYQNVVQLTGAPSKMNALTEVVYGAAQLVYGFSLMEQQTYLPDDVHDRFTDAFFQQQSMSRPRLQSLFERYGAAFSAGGMERLFVADLAASIGGKGRDDVFQLIRGVPRTLQRLTLLHTAQVFGDKKTVEQNS